MTLEFRDTEKHVTELFAALANFDLPIVFTYPNADTHGRIVIEAIHRFVETHKQAWAITNLGTQVYFSLAKNAIAMVGNSSSGIIEAASFELPVVNIGSRQKGRIHGNNVIDVDNDRGIISEGIKKAISAEFRSELTGMENPYFRGNAASIITHVLQNVPIDHMLIKKKFSNVSFEEDR